MPFFFLPGRLFARSLPPVWVGGVDYLRFSKVTLPTVFSGSQSISENTSHRWADASHAGSAIWAKERA